MSEQDLERQLEGALRALPAPRAPRTLVPRVLAAVEAQPARPAATGWFTWSPQWKAASLAAFLGLGAFGGWLLTSPPARVAGWAEETSRLYAVVRVLWSGIVEPLGIFVFVIGIAFALICAAAWAGLEAALGGASQR